ncbi:uncharacterized protein LOC125077248 [Vanessa atalanta]|uniref:uncharacterized protein LOC125077248 n=1 Tax=Vanessa atalanta TaxID=42275 RepID=UPI001FCDB651|nr:uncharacterized protein LOC125077248 [Vanessa atalanta]
MRGSVYLFLLLARTVAAITGPRIENDFDRSRQPPLGPTGFNDHQTRYGISPSLQNFQGQPNILSSPAPPIQFPQPIFQQQPYVPQFNNLLPAQNIPSNAPVQNNNGFQYNQPPSVNPINNLGQIQQHQNIPQPIPTLSAFQNNGLPLTQTAPQTFNPNQNIHSSIAQQRPTQAAFLPSLNTANNQAFSAPSPITIQAAPNLAPQNLNNQQIPFQSISQSPLYNNNNGQSVSQLRDYYEQQSKENLEKLKELQERQRIIQKHQEFVQKQQQKQQEKVEKLHEEFVSKQATKSIPSYTTTENYEDYFKRNQEKRRPLLPHETDLFRKAVEQYEKEHPTTTTSTTTTTTTTTTARPTTRYRTRSPTRTRAPPQDRNKQKLYNEIKNLLEESDTKGFDDNLRAKSVALLQKPDILKQLKVALAENPEDFNEKNFTSREISLNGQKFEVIRTTNPNLIPKGAIAADSPDLGKLITATQEPQKESRISFDDLTKGVLPPGANFELIKQADNGKLEEVSKIPSSLQNKKKVTFVFLEEQDDGTFKVKGVKANGQQTEEGPEVEDILNKIKKGEIQLPGPTKISNNIYTSSTQSPTISTTEYIAESSHHPSSYTSFVTTSNYGNSGHTNPIQTTPAPTYRNSIASSTRTTPVTQTYAPTTRATTSERYVIKSSTPNYIKNRHSHHQATRSHVPSTTAINTTPVYRTTPQDIVVIGSSAAPSYEESTVNLNYDKSDTPDLVDILKENGLFATAKYLKQSGLDAILNETGPYTIFAPTDKAFRTLLVQLGGPDRAEEKFRDNPRLLSGLLLHHVIPGAFDIGSLQDEMTGVSLAGTQLRVNQYDMHDVEWNEVRVTTINGARVLDDKKDIHIPQGIAHAVDRVMFPLPVGDLVQTLQADRDRRFTTFLKAIYASGFAETLAESKTYTVFAPTDAAFARLPAAELARAADRAGARALVARHVLPGTLYSAGMRYYQLRNSMEDAKPLTLQKSSGRIKVNNAQVITHNIPATNGVIHAVDTLL